MVAWAVIKADKFPLPGPDDANVMPTSRSVAACHGVANLAQTF
jgi:hypothetical protein